MLIKKENPARGEALININKGQHLLPNVFNAKSQTYFYDRMSGSIEKLTIVNGQVAA